MNGIAQITLNNVGERITLSILCFTGENMVLVREETKNQNMDEFNKITYELK